jgi:cytochrome c
MSGRAAAAAIILGVASVSARSSDASHFRLKAEATADVVSAEATKDVASGSGRTFQAAGAPRSVTDGVYTAEQAQRGRDQYRKRCVLCHLGNGQGHRATPAIPGESLEREGDREAPPIAGDAFLAKWQGQTAGALFDTLTATMPPGGAGTLKPQEYADLLAYLLEMNKLPAGTRELTPARDDLTGITLGRPTGH